MKLAKEFLIAVRPESYPRAKAFLTEFINGDVFIDDGYYYGVKDKLQNELCICCEETAPTEDEYQRGIWLSFQTNDFANTVNKLKHVEIREIKGGDSNAFFFSFPGGPVFKLINGEK